MGDADRTRVRHSAGGQGSCRATGLDGHWSYQLWTQAVIFPEMSLLCSSWQGKGFRKMHAWGTRTQPLTPFSPWHKPYNTEERPLVWQWSLQQSSSLQSLGALRAKAGDRLTPRDSRSFSFSPNRKHVYPGATVQGKTHTHTRARAPTQTLSHTSGTQRRRQGALGTYRWSATRPLGI